MRTIIFIPLFLLLFLLAMKVAFGQEPATKHLVIVGSDNVVSNKMVIPESWTEADWAPFVPEGSISLVEAGEAVHPGDRYIDGKIHRIIRTTRGDGWHKMEQIDINNPPTPLEQSITRPWELSPTWKPSAKVQIESLEARIMELERKGGSKP